MKVFDLTLSGHEVDGPEYVRNWLRGFVWCECETTEIDRPYLHSREFCEPGSSIPMEANGVKAWYCYGADYYWFEDVTDDI